jgi:hypothetical protein
MFNREVFDMLNKHMAVIATQYATTLNQPGAKGKKATRYVRTITAFTSGKRM